jgi:DNA-binding SARP family transcriptional activator/tetratricopeptide (TPR) repeat protein
VQVRLLGPVDVVVGGAPRPVPGPRRKSVLAVLGLHRGEIVSIDRLVDAVWGADPPPTAANTVQSHISQLRQILGSKTAIVARAPGYVLDLGAEGTDVQVAERLIGQGIALADHGARAQQLRSALALWRGRPLADVARLAWLAEQAHRLDGLWLQAARALVESRLALGEHAALVPELERLTREQRFDEQIHRQLILALYRSGRQADALAAYRRLRHTLDTDLGLEPSQPLRELDAAILRQDPTLDLAPPPVTLPAAESVPAQLPLAVPEFTGRQPELAALDAVLAEAGAQPAAVVISAVSGTAGVGKTALAVHWAHRVADRFPDGQLYVNLRGVHPGGQPTAPADALRGFLEALSVPAERIPAGLDARAALYRSRLAGKRVLVVLDNARDAEQARPLLPGTGAAVVVVTSRSQLTGLVAADGARLITLGLLSTVEARELLTRRLGADRLAAEPQAADEIIAGCARLPLAVAIAAARAATQPSFPLTVLAAELGQAHGRLDALTAGDHATDVRAVFSWSYDALTPPAARLFRLLGVHPGPDTSVPQAASLAGELMPGTRRLLAELAGANLITEHTPGRYACHDLLRAYATDLAHTHDTEADRRAAIGRLLDHHLHTAHAAARLLHPTRDPIPLPLTPPAPGASPGQLADPATAMAWLTTERPTLLAALGQAAQAGFDTQTWQLAWALDTFLDRRGHWHDLAAAWQAGLHAGERLHDPAAQAYALRLLGWVHTQLGRRTAARGYLSRALDRYAGAGSPVGQADTHYDLAHLGERQHQPAAALAHAQQALALYHAAGHRRGQALALNAVGWYHALLGDHAQALVHCRQALALNQLTGDRGAQAGAWDSLGYAHGHLDQHAEAIDCYQHALALFRDLGDRSNEADTLAHIGDTHHAAGNPEAARTAWQHALTIHTDLDHPQAAEVHTRLRALDPQPS